MLVDLNRFPRNDELPVYSSTYRNVDSFGQVCWLIAVIDCEVIIVIVILIIVYVRHDPVGSQVVVVFKVQGLDVDLVAWGQDDQPAVLIAL